MKKHCQASSLHGLAEILDQAPLVAAAFGKWPGFVLKLATILALFAVSLLTANRDRPDSARPFRLTFKDSLIRRHGIERPLCARSGRPSKDDAALAEGGHRSQGSYNSGAEAKRYRFNGRGLLGSARAAIPDFGLMLGSIKSCIQDGNHLRRGEFADGSQRDTDTCCDDHV